ncbi:MAG: CoA-binding protein, partial [Rhodocyclaceae bacterium]|nr:CoA-binding protein [Rhodocyclaceae bacterium]
MVDDIAGLRRVLTENRVIAVVGLSTNWHRPSYFAAKYMLGHGYTIIPVNPMYDEVLGCKCYPSLREVPV